MIEFFKHAFGLCGEHWHPNFITALAGSPVLIATYNYLKCKCGMWFGQHKSNCKGKDRPKHFWKSINFDITQEDIEKDLRK